MVVLPFVAGFVIAFFVLSFMQFVPLTKLQFGLIELSGSHLTEGQSSGTRLNVSGVRIHHYLIGLALIATGAGLFYFKIPKFVPFFLIGFGSLLVIDQIWNIFGLCQWDVPCPSSLTNAFWKIGA